MLFRYYINTKSNYNKTIYSKNENRADIVLYYKRSEYLNTLYLYIFISTLLSLLCLRTLKLGNQKNDLFEVSTISIQLPI